MRSGPSCWNSARWLVNVSHGWCSCRARYAPLARRHVWRPPRGRIIAHRGVWSVNNFSGERSPPTSFERTSSFSSLKNGPPRSSLIETAVVGLGLSTLRRVGANQSSCMLGSTAGSFVPLFCILRFTSVQSSFESAMTYHASLSAVVCVVQDSALLNGPFPHGTLHF